MASKMKSTHAKVSIVLPKVLIELLKRQSERGYRSLNLTLLIMLEIAYIRNECKDLKLESPLREKRLILAKLLKKSESILIENGFNPDTVVRHANLIEDRLSSADAIAKEVELYDDDVTELSNWDNWNHDIKSKLKALFWSKADDEEEFSRN